MAASYLGEVNEAAKSPRPVIVGGIAIIGLNHLN
jgi:hypothetical protein